MNTGLQINGPDKQAVEAVGDQLVRLLIAIGENHIDRETGIAAIEMLGKVTSVTVESCNFNDGMML